MIHLSLTISVWHSLSMLSIGIGCHPRLWGFLLSDTRATRFFQRINPFDQTRSKIDAIPYETLIGKEEKGIVTLVHHCPENTKNKNAQLKSELSSNLKC